MLAGTAAAPAPAHDVRDDVPRIALVLLLRVAKDSLTSHHWRVNATYSTYEAKARFSEVLRLVCSGTPVTVTRRGEPVAEIRPIQKPPPTVGERLDELERRGVLVRSLAPPKPLTRVARRAGALNRFLAERNR